ncbi:MAG TPA: hypothetical protein VH436_26775 [Vicinamibacterales bacterium]
MERRRLVLSVVREEGTNQKDISDPLLFAFRWGRLEAPTARAAG